ncbi:MAG: hypothetical protein R3C11_26825 [Planctomycetaceae bacterium]
MKKYLPRNYCYLALVLLIGVSQLGSLPAAEDEEVMFIREFLLLEDQWEYWKELETPLIVEGEVKSLTRLRLTFQQCDLVFKPEANLEFDRKGTTSNLVRVQGKLETDLNQELIFEVEKFEPLPDLEEQVELQRLEVGKAAPEAFYEMAARFRKYGEFYENDLLLKRADELFSNGLRTEKNLIRKDDYRTLFTLAERISQVAPGSRLYAEVVHEACQAMWKDVQTDRVDGPTFEQLLDRILDTLPGADAPLEEYPSPYQEEYLKSPLEYYNQADEFIRMELNRLFYGEVVLQHFRKQLEKDGSNGMELADRLQSLLPEETVLHHEFRKQGLNFKLDRIARLTRSEMLKVREYFIEYGEPEKAERAAREWLKNREQRVLEEGPAGVPQLADDREQLLGEENEALELLLKTIRTYPEAEPVKQSLEKRGYAFLDGSWRSRKDWKPDEVLAPDLQAMRQGIVVEGMTLKQVEQTLGFPLSTLQSVSASRIVEVWIYPQSSGKRIIVYFDRDRGASRTAAKVSKLVQQ